MEAQALRMEAQALRVRGRYASMDATRQWTPFHVSLQGADSLSHRDKAI